jgi:hypothetical protein
MGYGLCMLVVLMAVALPAMALTWIGGGYFAVVVAFYVGCVAIVKRLLFADAPLRRKDPGIRRKRPAIGSLHRFTIRDVLWLTVVVALSVAWWVDNKRIDKTVAQLEKEGKLLREALEDEREVLRKARTDRPRGRIIRAKTDASVLTP